jgi:hypothetical protein
MAEQVGSAAAPQGSWNIARAPAAKGSAAELREGERVLRHWDLKAAQFGKPPPLMAFDLSQMLKRDWAHRFLISADAIVENHAFLIYGARFAQLLGLPEMPVPLVPMMPQLPERYREVFAQGCADAIAEQGPVRLSGVVETEEGQREAYRAAFAPVAVRPNSLTQLVYGAFNRRILRSVFRLKAAAAR